MNTKTEELDYEVEEDEECSEEVDAEEAETEEDEEQAFTETVKQLSKNTRELSSIRRYLNEIGQFENLSTEEEIELGKRMSEGDAVAREKLINHNLRLVVSIAKKYASGGFTDFDELISLGNMGLIAAVDRYDWQAGVRVTTYATHWIKCKIEEGLRQIRNPIAKPKHVVDSMKMISFVTKNLSSILQREPSCQEISNALDARMSPEQVGEIIQLMVNNATVSLDAPIGGDEEDGVVGDMVCDNTSKSAETAMIENERTRALNEAIETLKPIHQRVIRLRFGFGESGVEPKSLDEVADILYEEGFRSRKDGRYCKEYIRQLEDAAMKELQSSPLLAGYNN